MLIAELVPLAADGYCDIDQPGDRGCCGLQEFPSR